MRSRRCSWLTPTVIVTVFAFILACSTVATAQETQNQEQETVAQMSRLSYIQGDVRLSRAIRNRDDLKKSWESAVANTAIEEGFGLATGPDGRAEFEFESGSVGYLAENSVLVFETLRTIDGLPATRLRLVTGTAAFAVRLLEGESFDLNLPPNGGTIPSGTIFRADSYLDGFVITPIRGGTMGVVLHGTGEFEKSKEIKTPSTPIGWNDWVIARQGAREAALPAAMKAAGVSAPFPGLLDLYANGRFFPCDPYGQCWAPIKETGFTFSDCWMGDRQYQETTLKDVRTGKKKRKTELLWASGPWLPCNYGSWIDNAWVFEPWMMRGHPRHHRRHPHHDGDNGKHHGRHHPDGPRPHPPGHWVKADGKTGFVPRHPNDVPGKPPLNLKNGIFVFKHKGPAERVPITLGEKFKMLRDEPREIRRMEATGRHNVAPPAIRGRLLDDARPGTPSEKPAQARVFDYDYRSKRFVEAKHAGAPERQKPAIAATMNSRGEVISVPHPDPGRQSPVHAIYEGRRDAEQRHNTNASASQDGDSHRRGSHAGDHTTGNSAVHSGGGYSAGSHSGSSQSGHSGSSSSGSGHSGGSSSGSNSGGGYSGGSSSSGSSSSGSSGSSGTSGSSGGSSGSSSGGGYSGGSSSGSSGSSSAGGSSGGSGGGHSRQGGRPD